MKKFDIKAVASSMLIMAGLFVVLISHPLSVGSAGRSHSAPVRGDAAAAVRAAFEKDLEHFREVVVQLQQLNRSRATEGEMKEAFSRCRVAYKRIEFLIEYFDPEFSKSFNGPNVPRLDPNVAALLVIEPEGLQVMEELVYLDKLLPGDREELGRLTDELLADTRQLAVISNNWDMGDRQILEACRAAIIRVMTLGLSGFDTPGSQASIKESAVIVEAVSTAMSHYYPFMQQRRGSVEELERLFAGAGKALAGAADFNSFDRVSFIKEFGNPLYKQLLKAHMAMGIEVNSETAYSNFPVNYDAENLFDEDLLDPWYHTANHMEKRNAAAAALGELLFFDPVLSSNNERACASCHLPEKAFTDGLPKSIAMNFEGDVGRNAPTVINSAYQSSLFHDGRAAFLEDQIDHVVFSSQEFNSDFETILHKIKQSGEYRSLFKKAFPGQPGDAINAFTLNKAIAEYVRSLKSFNSPFDRFMRGEADTLNLQAQKGFNVFMGKAKCGTCHFPPTFGGTVPPYYTDTEMEVLGITAGSDLKRPILDNDEGRYKVLRSPIYRHAFKTPGLRNIALTAPYMHNGAFGTLEEVIEFYDLGGGAGLGLDVPNQTLPADPLHLTEEEEEQLLSFLRSLSDTAGLNRAPAHLPSFPEGSAFNSRKKGGKY